MKSISKSKLAWTIPLMGVVFAALTVVQPFHTSALSASNFDRGHIIDDTIFTNSGSMSVQDIQNFLNAKVPTCDSWGTQPFAGTTRAIYSRNNGHPLPLVCLKDYYENPTTHANNLTVTDGQPVGAPAGSISAAQIIYNAAHAYNINPQVLLVTLQKEQGLVTDDWPWTNQYTHATGYGCPDSGGCDTDYYGLYNQVVNTAWQFRQYLNHPNNYNYVVGSNFILYSPQSGCGGSTVNILNQATAALYDYTPYQPNDGALSGMSDSSPGNTVNCGAYGNRNFWWFFNEWFGASLTSAYSWQWMGQAIYTDQTKSVPLDPDINLAPGQRYYVTMTVENMGTVTWTQGNVRLATVLADHSKGYISTDGNFYDSSWASHNRIGSFQESSVPPGGTATFGFWVTTPSTPGFSRDYINLVDDGASWFQNGQGVNVFARTSTNFAWQWTGQGTYTDQTKSTPLNPATNLAPNTPYYTTVTVKNTGNIVWLQGNVRLATVLADHSKGYISTDGNFYDSSWASHNRIGSFQESVVYPGQTATFEFWAKTPQAPGFSKDYLNLVNDSMAWFQNGQGVNVWSITNPQYLWQWVGQGLYTDQTKSTPVDPSTGTRVGTRYYTTITVKNTGNVTWLQGNVRLATVLADHSKGYISTDGNFYDSSWASHNRIGSFQESSVPPGGTATFGFWVTTPSTPGFSRDYINLVDDGASWFQNGQGVNVWSITH